MIFVFLLFLGMIMYAIMTLKQKTNKNNLRKINYNIKLYRAIYNNYIQLFREKLSEKVRATIPKGIVGGFEFTVVQRSLKKGYERPRTYVCGS